MMTPLDNWSSLKRGYRFGQKTSYSNFHLGLDLSCSVGTPVRAPESGSVVLVTVGSEGGLTMHYRLKSGPLVRFLHLSRVIQHGGIASEGETLALTGGAKNDQPNAGNSSGPHLHVDISRDGRLELDNLANFIDPDSFFTQDIHMALVQDLFKKPAANDSVRVILVTEGKDAGKVGLLLKDGTLRVTQKGKTKIETLANKFQVLNAALSKGASSEEWAILGQKEGEPID